MKLFYTWLLFSLGWSMSLTAQTIVHWPLSPDHLDEPKSFVDEALGYPFVRGNGLSTLNYSGSGVSAQNWPLDAGDNDQVDYYEFGLKATPGATLNLTELSFMERRSSSGPLTFRIVYSRDGFATETELTQVNLPDDINTRTHSFSFQEKIKDGESLLFRFYAYHAESNSGSWTIRANSLSIAGEVMATCSPPTSTATLSLLNVEETTAEVNLTAGNGQARILIMSTTAQPLTTPYQGDVYTGSLTYGAGQRLGASTYVIATTSATNATFIIEGLEPGATYQLGIVEYNTAQMCYAPQSMTLNITTLCAPDPRAVNNVAYTPLDASTAMRWEGPTCADRYLVVASETPIDGEPIGLNFTADPNFGDGNPAIGFNAITYPLYFGDSEDPLVVTGLTNSTTYYFAVYVLLNGQWSEAYTFEATPEESCPRLYPERIFINEFHYSNGPISQDQGVEIAGPAGVDLSNYELVVQQRVGGNLNVFLVEVYRSTLSGIIDDEGAGFGAIWFPVAAMPLYRGYVSLLNTITDEVVDFIAYDPAFGLRDILSPPNFSPINPSNYLELPTDVPGFSFQRVGEGNCPSGYTWARLPHSRGRLNPGQTILPVALNFLAAEAVGKTARIYWQTSAESGSDYFTVEQSTDGRNFTKIGTLAAAGFSQDIRDYELYDLQPASGINYYRLLQVDYDGTIHNEGIVTVRFDGGPPPPLNLFPNPVVDFTTVRWATAAEALHLVDAQGKLLQTIPLDATSDGGTKQLDMSAYPAGIYFVRSVGQKDSEVCKLIKK
ncbi:T9SS type A sorting domain-containing protein [Lewinella sp. LCG006]|uniref:T9SS type A sorting domain-containing protein n=1 Tax=Lewinella sp. LCG006 TaxID=3231911 RepID=UPI00345FDD56